MGASQVNEDRIGHKVQAYLFGTATGIEVAADSVGNLILELPQILALRGDPALIIRGVPGSNEQSGFIASLELEHDLVHICKYSGCSPS